MIGYYLISLVDMSDIQLRKPSTWDIEKIRLYFYSTTIQCVHRYSMLALFRWSRCYYDYLASFVHTHIHTV